MGPCEGNLLFLPLPWVGNKSPLVNLKPVSLFLVQDLFYYGPIFRIPCIIKQELICSFFFSQHKCQSITHTLIFLFVFKLENLPLLAPVPKELGTKYTINIMFN